MLVGMWQRVPSALLAAVITGAAVVENHLAVPQKHQKAELAL